MTTSHHKAQFAPPSGAIGNQPVQVGEVQGDALATIIAALEHSKPTHGHYPEPVKRHADALAHARALAARQPVAPVPSPTWTSFQTLEVGRTYQLRSGGEIEITAHSGNPNKPFKSSHGSNYRSDGRYYGSDDSCLDLVKVRMGESLAQGIDLAPRPMDTAPRDGTLVRLLVDFDENAIEDSIGATWTIGACNDDNVSEGARIGWQFAGWCWTHDHFTQGTGTPVGWLPLIDSQRDAAPGAQAPMEMSPDFTDTARAAIAWVLWHHQGGSSPVGQPLRFALGMGSDQRLSQSQIDEAKRFAEWTGATTEGFHRHRQAQGIDLGQVREIRIPARNNLDPISVFVQDQAAGRGRIVVTCYGNAWQAFWGAMGDRTVMEFVAQCDADYVAGNMLHGRQTRIAKHERAYTERIATEVIAEFRTLRDSQRDAAPGVGNG